MTDLTPIVTAVLTLIGAIITTILIPYIRSKTTAAQRANIATLVGFGVKCAEQIIKGPGRGAEKKAWVLDWLKGQGLTYDDALVDAMIETAVFALPEVIVAGDTEPP